MRLRNLTPDEHGDVAVLRRRLQATHGSEAATAPFMTEWLTVPAAGGGVRLHGLCWGHPGLGDTVVTTTPVVEMTEAYARTSSGRLYLLGPEDRDHSRKRRLQGNRGPLVIAAAAEPEAVPDFRR
jgi:hypothetical protein